MPNASTITGNPFCASSRWTQAMRRPGGHARGTAEANRVTDSPFGTITGSSSGMARRTNRAAASDTAIVAASRRRTGPSSGVASS